MPGVVLVSLRSFKRYVTPEGRGGGRVVNFVTNRYGNQGGGERVSVMSLRDVDKLFYMANFTRNLPIGSYSLYYLTPKTRYSGENYSSDRLIL